MAKQVEYFRWWIVDERTGKRRRTTYAMDRETALERFPAAEPDPATRKTRTHYEPGEAPANTKPPKG